MKIKWIMILSAIMVMIFGVLGIAEKQTYTNWAKEAEPLAHFEVVAFTENEYPCQELLSDDDSYEQQLYDESEYILKARAVGDFQLEFRASGQLFEVEKVFRGEALSEGEVVRILYGNIGFPEGQNPVVDLGYTNIAKDGEEYLIFTDAIEGEKNPDKEGHRTFGVAWENIMPLYAYQPGEGKAFSEIGIEKNAASYGEVKDNEYFAATPNALRALHRHREQMIRKYQ